MADFTIHDLDLPEQEQSAANGYAPGSGASISPIHSYNPHSEGYDSQPQDPLGKLRQDALTPDPESKYNPQYFDWNKSRAEKFVKLPQYKDIGYDPALGQQFADERFHEAESGWETAKRTGEGFFSNMGQGIVSTITNLKNIGSWFSDPSLQISFKQDQLEAINKKQEEFENNYYIPQGIDPGLWNKIARGVQESGTFLGSFAEIAAFSALTGGVAGAIGAVGEGVATTAGLEEGITAAELAANTTKIADAISAETNPGLWRNVSELASKAIGKVPIPGSNTFSYLANASTWTAEGGAAANTARGFAAFATDINTINTATAFASGNAAATYQQSLNDQVEQYKQSHGGKDPEAADLQGFKDRALKSAKVDGALNAYAMLILEKLAFANLLNTRSTLQEAIEKSGRGIYDRVGVKPLWAKGAEEEPLYLKQQAKWYNFKANLTNNYYEGLRDIGAKGIEFGVMNNIMSGIDKGVKSYFDAKYDNKDISVFDAFRNGVDSQFTKEGGNTFISGFLQGALLLGIGGAALGRIKGSLLDKTAGRSSDFNALADESAKDFIRQVNTAWTT